MSRTTSIARLDRSLTLDLIRALAILGVLAIHVTYPIYARPDFAGGTVWWFAQAVNAVSRISIPLFIMLSGYLLIPKRESVSGLLQRTWWRIGIPLTFWSAGYFVWDYFWFQSAGSWESLGGLMNLERWGSLVNATLSGGYGHLYFLVIMLMLYLSLPLLRLAWQHGTDSEQRYLTAGLLLLGLVFTGLQFFHLEDSAVNLFVVKGLPYLGYFYAGAYFGSLTFSSKQLRFVSGVWLVSTIATAVLSYWNLLWMSQGQLLFWDSVPYFDHYVSLNVMLVAVSGFVVLKHRMHFMPQGLSLRAFAAVRAPIVWGIKFFSASAMGLYVLHPMVMNVLDRAFGFQVDFMSESLALYLVKRTILVVLCTAGLVTVIRTVPVVKKTLGE